MNESTTLLVLIIGSVFAFLAALCLLLTSMLSHKANKTTQAKSQNSEKLPSSEGK